MHVTLQCPDLTTALLDDLCRADSKFVDCTLSALSAVAYAAPSDGSGPNRQVPVFLDDALGQVDPGRRHLYGGVHVLFPTELTAVPRIGGDPPQPVLGVTSRRECVLTFSCALDLLQCLQCGMWSPLL